VRPYLEKPFIKRAGGVAQGGGPKFKSQYKKNPKAKRARVVAHVVEHPPIKCSKALSSNPSTPHTKL
jgi:hypothetical protein